jgi:hypothetical protein
LKEVEGKKLEKIYRVIEKIGFLPKIFTQTIGKNPNFAVFNQKR